MTPRRVQLGPRRVAALVTAAAGIVLFGLVTFWAGVGWGLVLLAGLTGAILAGTAVTAVELRRQLQLVGARDRATAERWQVFEGELKHLRQTTDRDRVSHTARWEALSQSQQQIVAATAWRVARERAERDGSVRIADATREAEIALIAGSDLFDTIWYQQRVGARLADPAAHYVDAGVAMGLDPHPLFSSARYLERQPEALAHWRTPLGHYLAAERERPGGSPTPVVRYDRHGNPDEADLKWEYLARGLHREPDTFVLYRVIGNDLPPRHRAGQGLENLRFVLDHEPDLPGCQKRWVVNRIVDRRIEKQIIALLEERGQPYLHLPFEPDEYRRVGWRFAELEPPGLTYRREFEALNPNQRQRALDHVYHHKNLYVMNNNGARNAALQDGRGLAKWVLPWDGNCFLTRSAWDDLVATVTARPYLKYYTVPMARIVDNQVLLQPAPIVDATEEPQLLFRRDAAEQFNPDARYGRRPKVELFYRLRIPGPWDEWGRVAWDDPPPPASPEARQVGQASWVARMFSGEEALEVDANNRQWRRIEAIRECIDAVDQGVARQHYDPSTLLIRGEEALEQQRSQWTDREPGPVRVVSDLVSRAERVGGGPPASDLRALAEQLSVAALAGWFTRHERYFTQGAAVLRSGLRRSGVLGQARRRRAGRGRAKPFTVAEAHDIDCLLDAARLLDREGALRAQDTERLRTWCAEHRRWLVDSAPGRDARRALDQRGTWYDVQLAALDAYLGDIGGMLATLRRAHERVGQQLGLLLRPYEERRHEDASEASTVSNLLGWARLAAAAARLGQDLWSYRAPGGHNLPVAIQRLLDRPWPGPDADRLAVLAHLCAAHAPATGLADTVDEPLRDPWRVRQTFDRDGGVVPFWVLGSEVGHL